MEAQPWISDTPIISDLIFLDDHQVLNLAPPDPHDGSPANIDPEHQKELEETGRLDTDDDDFEPAGDMDEPEVPDEE